MLYRHGGKKKRGVPQMKMGKEITTRKKGGGYRSILVFLDTREINE